MMCSDLQSPVSLPKIIIHTRTRPVIVDKGISIALGGLARSSLRCQITDHLVHLTEVFPLSQRRILNSCPPALRIREPSLADSIKDVVACIDRNDGAIPSVLGDFMRAKQS